MIIGANKKIVINNIKNAAQEGDFHRKVEVDDPDLSFEEKQQIIDKYLKQRRTFLFRCKTGIARTITNAAAWSQNRDTKIVGMENLERIHCGAIITSNHFNPLDNTVVRKMAKKAGKKTLYVVGQETNLAMKGIIGFLMNYADIIPISNNREYMRKSFIKILNRKLQKNEFVLIYPEQEMWFNYRKPRPPKRGAYYYAAKLNVPIISCFVEIQDKKKKDTEEFRKVRYVMHVLPPIYPQVGKSVRENSNLMMKKDYIQKRKAYEKAYGKKLAYGFEDTDIAGWISKDVRERT